MHKLAMLIYGVLRSGQPFDVDFEKKKLAIQDGIWPFIYLIPLIPFKMASNRFDSGDC